MTFHVVAAQFVPSVPPLAAAGAGALAGSYIFRPQADLRSGIAIMLGGAAGMGADLAYITGIVSPMVGAIAGAAVPVVLLGMI